MFGSRPLYRMYCKPINVMSSFLECDLFEEEDFFKMMKGVVDNVDSCERYLNDRIVTEKGFVVSKSLFRRKGDHECPSKIYEIDLLKEEDFCFLYFLSCWRKILPCPLSEFHTDLTAGEGEHKIRAKEGVFGPVVWFPMINDLYSSLHKEGYRRDLISSKILEEIF